MKKIVRLFILLMIVISVTACNNVSQIEENKVDYEWTHIGNFEDRTGKTLYLSEPSDFNSNVFFVIKYFDGEITHHYTIQQVGETLAGDLSTDSKNSYIVTAYEEGDDGILLITPDDPEGIHFKPLDLPDSIGTIKASIKGSGQISYSYDKDRILFYDDDPSEYIEVNLMEPTTYAFGAKANKGYRFVKWTINGEDLSTDEIITYKFDKDSELIAFFEKE